MADEVLRKPVKFWHGNIEQVGPECLERVANLTKLPFVFKWPALMPNLHEGQGVPVGSVVAAEGVIIPNAVGEDIGCGTRFVLTDIHSNLLKIEVGQTLLLQDIIDCVMRNVPAGQAQHQEKQTSRTLGMIGEFLPSEHRVSELEQELRAALYQLGTLGGGGHFIEIQEDESGNVGIMVHSGSRNLGLKICKYFNELAKKQNEQWYSSVPKEYDLAFFPEKSGAAQAYLNWMKLAVAYAEENREKIITLVKGILLNHVRKYGNYIGSEKGKELDCKHNYAEMEHHFGKDVWVHRRGTIRAREGDIGIIPGSMGSFSFIVEGRGHPDSFSSCANGAGRILSRKKALEKYSAQSVVRDLKQNEIILGKINIDDIAEECRGAYNEIEAVMDRQRDLLKPVKKLRTLGVIKG
jgi:tRNA-splicing ligase RtcB